MDVISIPWRWWRTVRSSTPLEEIPHEEEHHFSIDAAPLIFTAAFMLILLVSLSFWARRCRSTSEVACGILLLPHFVLLLGFTIVILDSNDISIHCGMPEGASGLLIGIYMAGAAAGFVWMWASLKFRPSLWREAPRRICLGSFLLHFLGMLLYLFATLNKGYSLYVWVLARVIGGIGQGVVAQLVNVSLYNLMIGRGLEKWMFNVMLCNTIAIGGGPTVSAAVHYVSSVPAGTPNFQITIVCHLVIVVMSTLGFLANFPDVVGTLGMRREFSIGSGGMRREFSIDKNQLSPVASLQEITPTASFELPHVLNTPQSERRFLNTPQSERRGRDNAQQSSSSSLIACIVVYFIRCSMVSGTEVVSAELFERYLGMSLVFTGCAVGLCFLSSIPFRIFYTYMIKDRFSPAAQFRICASSACFGALLLLRQCQLLLDDRFAVLLADCIIFPSAFLCDSMTFSRAMRCSLPVGSLLDSNHISFWCNLFGAGLGRVVGPWMGRYLIEAYGASGQDLFAILQLIYCILMMAIFEIWVYPLMAED